MKKRILASLLSLCLLLGLLPTTAWATGGESEGGGSTTAAGTLSDNISVESTSNVTRAQLAEMVMEGRIEDGKTVAAVLKTKVLLGL